VKSLEKGVAATIAGQVVYKQTLELIVKEFKNAEEMAAKFSISEQAIIKKSEISGFQDICLARSAEKRENKGVAGLVPYSDIYAFSSTGKTKYSKDLSDYIDNAEIIIELRTGCVFLIGNGAKVVNYSQNSGHLTVFAASNGNVAAQNFVKAVAESIAKFLKKLIDTEFCSVIVTSAGNTNNDVFYEYNSAEYAPDNNYMKYCFVSKKF
jgi:hypothetical protein